MGVFTAMGLVSFASQLPFVGAAASGALAIAASLRARRAVARWSFAGGMAVLAAECLFSGLSDRASLAATAVDWQVWKLRSVALLPGTWLLFSLTYARGNAREFLSKWTLTVACAFAVPLAIVVLFAQVLFVSPAYAQNSQHLGWAGVVLYLVFFTGAVLVLTNLERTFRASVGTMRWRIKFMLLGVGILFLVRIYTSSQTLLFRGIDPFLESVNSAAVLVAAPLILRSFFRTGHFDLDVHPSRSVLQGSLTVFLTGVYLLVVGILAKVVAHLGGDATFGFKAFVLLVALVLLAVLLQSDRVRLHLRRFVARNFQRPFYDYRTVWTRFTEGTASRVDQADLCRSLVRLTAEMFQALSVTIWLVDESRETLVLAASTSVSEAPTGQLEPQKAEVAKVLAHFREHAGPADVESSKDGWAAAVRRWHPSQFPHGGHRVCIPMIGRGEMLGLITIGDRVSGLAFTLQDFDMLKCVGDHAAANLLSVQLAGRLLQAKELEAFQTMAAFFVHDLKNAASTLNLTLQNLPVHFDDPAFRQDALRGMSKSVNHINHLIGRLSLLRQAMKIQAAETDLNDLVTQSVAGLKIEPASAVVTELGALPPVVLDPEQMRSVVTNLVLNGHEAVGRDGQVRVATASSNGWAVLTVADNGCGMSPEFLKHSLFRPFQTTKKNGLGIGMFQSMTIVQAHGGRMEVASEPGKGTTFQVFLPLKK